MTGQNRSPKWTEDEVLLALDCYFNWRPNIPDKTSQDIEQLSMDIRAVALKLGLTKTPELRNVNGVYMKLMNFKAIDPDYSGAGLKSASELDRRLFFRFYEHESELSTIASAIRASVASGEVLPIYDEPEDVEYQAEEGRLLTRTHRVRERDSKLIKKKKEAVFKAKGHLSCEGCSFDFAATYGQRGEGFIECHHVRPVADLKLGQKTSLSDLALLCSNCHRMIHRGRPWLSIEELQTLLEVSNEPSGIAN